MKKSVIFGSFIAVFAILFSSCASSYLYKIENKEIKNIDGTIYLTSMPLWADIWAMYYSDDLTITKIRQNNTEFYRFEVNLCLSDWLFIDKLNIKINNGNTITLTDKNPMREVIPASTYYPTRVRELAYFILDESIVNELKNCNAIVFQHKREPVTLPQEAINATKNFLQ
jgi:hypothetical protein